MKLTANRNSIYQFYFLRLCNGQEITPSNKHKIESKGNVNKLTIPKADLTDTGVYEVVLSNGIETIKAQSKLDVCIKPKVEGKNTTYLDQSYFISIRNSYINKNI